MCLTSLSEHQLTADLFNLLFRHSHRANQKSLILHPRVFSGILLHILLLWLIYLLKRRLEYSDFFLLINYQNRKKIGATECL